MSSLVSFQTRKVMKWDKNLPISFLTFQGEFRSYNYEKQKYEPQAQNMKEKNYE